MAISTNKDFNTAARAALLEESDGTISKQIRIVGSKNGTTSTISTKKDYNGVIRGALVDESDGTTANQIISIGLA